VLGAVTALPQTCHRRRFVAEKGYVDLNERESGNEEAKQRKREA